MGIHHQKTRKLQHSPIANGDRVQNQVLQREGVHALQNDINLRRRVEDTEKRLRAGEALKFQRNKSQGGISYTVAEEAGVVWALEEIIDIDTANRVYKFSINQGENNE